MKGDVENMKKPLYMAYVLVLLLCIPLQAFGSSEPPPGEVSVEAVNKITFQMGLPKDIIATDFSENSSAIIQQNGKSSELELRGVPFLYKDRTYVPVRDVAEALGLHVEYNDKDRFVTLRSGRSAMFIAPEMINIGHFYRYHEISYAYETVSYSDGKMNPVAKREDSSRPSFAYILIDDRSYVPLRAVMEFLGFSVYYDDASKSIVAEGVPLPRSQNEKIFSDEQERLIGAFTGYESARILHYRNAEGIYTINISTVVQTKSFRVDSGEVLSRYAITTEEGEEYESMNGIRLAEANSRFYPIYNGDMGNVVKLLPSGERKQVDKYGIPLHPLLGIGETFLSGSNKYKEMEITKLSETEKTETMIVTMIDGLEVSIEVEIDKSSGKLCRYTEKMASRLKSWEVQY